MMDLPPKPVAVDGAKLRLYRMARLAMWLREVDGATLEKVRAFMTLKFGLRARTTEMILKDMLNARILQYNGPKLQLTKDGEKWLQLLGKEGEF